MFKLPVNRINDYWRQLTGDARFFSLESRIFHSFSVFILFTISLATIHNLVSNLPVSALITFLIVAIQAVLYYVSRVKRRFKIAVLLSATEINILTAIKYFFNAGMLGPTLLTSALSLYLIILVVPKKQWLLWFSINLIVILTVTSLEYRYPELILHKYNARSEMFIDNLVGYLIVVFMIYMCTAIVRDNYDEQKQLSDETTMSLQLLNAEKDKLFSIISHDLNAPLSSAKQYLSSLAELELAIEDRLRIEAELLKTINSTQDMLVNLLKWARNQMHNTRIQLQKVNARDLLLQTAGVFEHIALNKGIQLDLVVEDDIYLMADIDMIQLVVRNLLNNAVKFTESGGEVEVKAYLENGLCIISVKDNGIGISPARQKDVFSFKAGTTYGTENEKGAGLGLVLCKDYTELQGGKIWFTSTENIGTNFFISLPLAPDVFEKQVALQE